MEYRNKRRLLVIITIILFALLYAFKNYSMTARVFSIIFGLYFFYFFDRLFYVQFQLRHYFYALGILIFGVLLSPLYFISSNYDKILHLIMPILGSAMVFFAIDRLKIDFKWKLLLTFTSLITFLVILEIGEFALDKLFDLKSQGVYLRDMSGLVKYKILMDRNDDTMIDMILGITGSLIFVISKTMIFYYQKNSRSFQKPAKNKKINK